MSILAGTVTAEALTLAGVDRDMRRARDHAVDVEEGALAGQPKVRGILRQVQKRVLLRKRLARCQHRGVHGDAGWLPSLQLDVENRS